MLNKKTKIIVMVVPAITIILSILFLSLYTGISQSLGYFPEIGMTDITLDFYKKILHSKTFLLSIKFTFIYSFVSAILSIVIGILLAIVINKYNSKLAERIMNIPIVVPHMIFALVVIQLLSQTGLVSRLVYSMGLLNSQESFLLLLFNKRNTVCYGNISCCTEKNK